MAPNKPWLLNVFPGFLGDNHADIPEAYAVFCGKLSLRCPRQSSTTNISHISFFQFRAALFFSNASAVLKKHVQSIVCWSSKEKMRRSNASTGVTLMKNVKTARDGFVFQKKTQPMCRDILPGSRYSYLSISPRVQISYPDPASRRFLYFLPKSFSKFNHGM